MCKNKRDKIPLYGYLFWYQEIHLTFSIESVGILPCHHYDVVYLILDHIVYDSVMMESDILYLYPSVRDRL